MALAMEEKSAYEGAFGEEMITPEELAQWLRVSDDLVYKWLNNRELHGFQLGRLWRIPRSSIDTFLIQHSNVKYQEAQQET